jgi:CheY-like chemotaxis protein
MANILIVDDDEKIRSVFSRFLTGKDHMVTCAEDGQEGLHMLEAEPPDLIITDIMMPNVDGLEVILAIRKKDPNLPIIAVSGGMHAMPMDFLSMAEKLGAGTVLHKPVLLDDLLYAVNEALA